MPAVASRVSRVSPAPARAVARPPTAAVPAQTRRAALSLGLAAAAGALLPRSAYAKGGMRERAWGGNGDGKEEEGGGGRGTRIGRTQNRALPLSRPQNTHTHPSHPHTHAGKYTPVKDTQDGYEFVYPFGWQEVSVDGQDVVYKDIIEPLESVSVSVTSTDKASIDDFGPPEDVASTLATKVLTPASQQVKVLAVGRRVDEDGRPYVEFEFAAKSPVYLRHALASVAVANGKLYVLTTGANDLRRWGKVEGMLRDVVKSFKVVERYG